MKGRLLATRTVAVGLAIGALGVERSLAQFAPSSYPPTSQSAYSQAPAFNQQPPAYRQQAAAYPQAAPVQARPAPTAYAPTAAPAYAAPAQQAAPAYAPPAAPAQVAVRPQGYPAAPAYGFPRVAQAGELPLPPDPIQAAAPMAAPTAPMQGDAAADSSADFTAPDPMGAPMFTAPGQDASFAAPSAYGAGCETGECGEQGYGDGCYADCAPACDVRPRRQWFVGFYGLYLDRLDTKRQQVAYFTDTAGFAAGTPYYYTPGDAALWTDDADVDDLYGAELRIGSTFGHDACGCGQPFAWEFGYWALDDGDGDASILIQQPIGPTAGFTERLYGTIDYSGIELDLDGAGATFAYRPLNDYNDYGVPADGDVNANDIRVLGVRVRQRFQAQNLELNFWRFGTPAASPSLLGGVKACGLGRNGCDPCGPSLPPRRFFINGLAGIRYFRVDDDMGIDRQFTVVDGAGDPIAGFPTQYSGFDPTSNTFFLHDIQADNDLVGLQIGSSMNWLIGCRWNVFADSNFGIYSNHASVRQSVAASGGAVARYVNGATAVDHEYSDTDVAFLGELRAGVGYQLSCRCRVTAAYRFIGAGGLALAADQIPTAGYANPTAVQYVHNNSSLVLHGAQLGAEWKY